MKRRSLLVYGALAAIWVLLIGWQAAEHERVETSARAALSNSAKDISNTLGLLMRSQRFFGVISKERLESALNALVSHGELHSVALLNATEEIVASAGSPVELPPKGEFRGGERWGQQTVTLINLIDLGTNVTRDLELTNLEIVMPSREFFESFQSNRPPREPRPMELDRAEGTNAPERPRHGWRTPPTNDFRAFVRPHWMKEEEYQSVIKKKGVHSFVIVMSTQSLRAALKDDRRIRMIIGILGTISVLGLGLAWRNITKTSDLQIRLVRASEQNLHLQQMNLAAAGLAHETRNPLNIIRGLAQLISKEKTVTPEVQGKSRDIINETDRVTAQLNEFINYSRPRQVHRAPTNLAAISGEVARALSYDIEEKKIRFQLKSEPLTIEADEPLLRQALFNLVLNAVQAVGDNGEIQIRARKVSGTEASLEICDNGPGVSAENRTEIFKPYFTTHQKGTGLGLAIVQQIIAAHGWEIDCQPNQPKGAIFRISHIKIM